MKLQIEYIEFSQKQIIKFFQNFFSIFDYFEGNFKQYK